MIREALIERNGQRVTSLKTAFRTAVVLAGLDPGEVTPHVLRHSCATWLMQSGIDKWEAAGFPGMSVEMLDRVYGHHPSQPFTNSCRSGRAQKGDTIIGEPESRHRQVCLHWRNVGGILRYRPQQIGLTEM